MSDLGRLTWVELPENRAAWQAVEELWDPASRRELLFTSSHWPEGRLVDGIPVGDRVLWGMTLRLLDDVVPRLLAGEWQV